MAGASFVAIFALNVPFPLIVLVAAIIGYVGGRFAPGKFVIGGGHGAAKNSFGPALIDDDTPTPEHARFSWGHLVHLLLVGGALWVLPMGLLTLSFGWDGSLTQMLVLHQGCTDDVWRGVRGAALCLPGAVGHYGWLTPTQMIDGLALGETTPGPLIMVVAFVGFIGGYVHPMFGAEHPFLAGAVAASLVTWFTFLPSFIFILAGGPVWSRLTTR